MSDGGEATYHRIFKTSALLGGSSLINVGLSILRTKVFAVRLGPSLYGVMGLYMGVIGVICAIASLGVGQSAIREIAAAEGTGDRIRIARTIRAYRRLVWVTGIGGAVLMMSLAYPMSWWTFGDGKHMWAIAVLSLTVLFSELQTGQTALLSGLRRIRDVTLVNLTGAVFSTVCALPVLVMFRERGVVPFLIAVAGGQTLASWWYARRVVVSKVVISWRETWHLSGEMLRFGLVFVVSGLSVTFTSYIVRLIINRHLGDRGVGLYQAAMSIGGVYVGFVLQAMAGDYYPRLSAAQHDAGARNRLINEQAEMALLMALPGLVVALVFSSFLITALYSSRFDGADDVLRWVVLGLLARILSWCIGFVLLARGDKLAFLLSELSAACVQIVLSIAAVRIWGIAGAGMAFAGMYFLVWAWIAAAARRRHEYVMRRSTWEVVVITSCLVGGAFVSTFVPFGHLRIGCGVGVALVSCWYSATGLRRRLGGIQSWGKFGKAFAGLVRA